MKSSVFLACCLMAVLRVSSAEESGQTKPKECTRYNFILTTEQMKSKGIYEPLQYEPLQALFEKCKPFMMAELLQSVSQIPSNQRDIIELTMKQHLESEGEDMASFRGLAQVIRASATQTWTYYMENPGPFHDLCIEIIDRILRPFVTFYQLEIYDLVFKLPKYSTMNNDMMRELVRRTDETTAVWIIFARSIRRYDITASSVARKVAREMERGTI